MSKIISYIRFFFLVLICLKISILAQNTASHTIRVNIVRLIRFEITPLNKPSDQIGYSIQSTEERDDFKVSMKWQNYAKSMQITASIRGYYQDNSYRLKVNHTESCIADKEIILSNDDRRLFYTKSKSKGTCDIDYVDFNELSENSQLVYTMTDG